MAVFRETSLVWKGETYTFTPSLTMLRKIESRGVNLLQCANGFLTGQMHVAMASECILGFLQQAMGEKNAPSGDEVYGWFVHAAAKDRDAYDQMVWTIVTIILPDIDLGKKQEAPESKQTEAMGSEGK